MTFPDVVDDIRDQLTPQVALQADIDADLVDRIALEAMKALLPKQYSTYCGEFVGSKMIARDSYTMADAMLAERQRRKDTNNDPT